MLKQELINQHDLLESITPDVTVLTGNNRLANDLINKFDHFCLSNKKSAWSSPDIVPINSWLIRVWEEALLSGNISSDKVLLSNEQEYQVWESIIKESTYGNGLLRISATTKSVSDAWRTLQNWNLTLDNNEYQASDDSRAFHYWSTEFEKRCAKENWITASQLASENYYSKVVNSNKIMLIGFDELTPQFKLLFTNFESSSSYTGSVKLLQFDQQGDKVSCLKCDNVRDEIVSFALWAKQSLEENSENKIGLVLPDINSVRPILLHTLERVLMPSNCSPIINHKSINENTFPERPWDISMGVPLVNYSIIKLVFQLLSLIHGKIAIETISSLLRSPHIEGASSELNQRALLDRQLRELGEPFLSLKTVLFYSNHEDKNHHCPIISKIVISLIEFKKTCFNKAGSQQWVEWLGKWLIISGWATGRTLSSEEYQTIEAWKKLLQNFTSLKIVINKMTLEEAISCLHRLATDKIFQIQSKSAPIQILGLYESIGLDFDHLWVMNLHDENWPVSPRQNPFIPIHIQKKFGLPHASWDRELIIAKQIITRLENSAKNVVFSYPDKNGTQELRISPLIREYSNTSKLDLKIKSVESWQDLIIQESRLDVLNNDTVAVVGQERVTGGSSIFKNQSLCPFRALVENRLHAKPMRKSQPGLDAMKRGTLVHSVLERFWKVITNQHELKSKTKKELEIIIIQCIDETILEMATKSPNTFSDSFTRIEKQRLLKLVMVWLELEAQRAPFSVVDIEREINITINGVDVRLFIDRIDKLENDRKLIIDYKTGLVSPTDWFGERPNEPQLPLYSIAYNENISAVLFAQIKTGQVKFNGVVEAADLIPDLPPTKKSALKEATEQWPTVLQDWDIVLHSLADNFTQSHIEVDPKEGTTTCRKLYCELSPLCRINELIEKNDLIYSDDQSETDR